jgi:ferrous iron transport protein B
MSSKTLKIALAGNPNSGKTTLFNALTGLKQKVGNYPGITVEKKTGKAILSEKVLAEIIDLPGTYSLFPKSMDEQVAQQTLCNNDNEDYPDVTVVIADATNLRRSIFLLTQIIDLNMEVVLALNMVDIATKKRNCCRCWFTFKRIRNSCCCNKCKERKGDCCFERDNY